jgi:hypothetical protein
MARRSPLVTASIANARADGSIPVEGLIALAIIVALIVFWRVVLRHGRVQGKKYYPRGKPGDDLKRLTVWWSVEMKHAGLNGTPAVSHQPTSETSPRWGAWRSLLEGLAGTTQLHSEHVYSVDIPNTPWGLQAGVFTTGDGTITYVVYSAKVRRVLSGPVSMQRDDATLGRPKLTGPGCEGLNADANLRKALARALSKHHARSYYLGIAPWRTISFEKATCKITPTETGADLRMVGTVRTTCLIPGWPAGSFPLEMTFCLKEVVTALRALEAGEATGAANQSARSE